MKRATELIEQAIKLTNDYLLEPDKTVNERRKGDIASFGTALMQSSLLPAVALFSDTSNSAGKRRNQMLNVLHVLLDYGQISKVDFANDPKHLLKLVLAKNESERSRIRYDLMQASIALKLAMRTFQLKKVESHDD